MAVLSGLDYSWARPEPIQIRAAGIPVVARYLHESGKGLTLPEVNELHAAGIGILLNYEADAGDHLRGPAQGVINGANARRLAADLGAPKLPIYYSCDREVSPDAMPTVMGYLQAADSTVHESRCYAQATVCDNWGRPAWQTIAWSNGALSPHAVFYQWAINQDFHGSAVDYNQTINAAAIGAWWAPGTAPESAGAKPLVVKKPWEEDMQFIRFINSGPKNNNFAVYQVVGDKLLYINPLTNGWLGKPKPLVVDKRSSYWLMPMVAGSPDFRGK